MPNDCLNSMTVGGTPEAVHQFKESLKLPDIEGKESIFSFNQLVPIPEEEKNNSYNWCISNWGTKWEPYDVQLSENNQEINIGFYTAWSPPEDWIRAACKKIPGLIINLRYEEMGMNLYGDIFCNGVTYTNKPFEPEDLLY